jgi:hypothetical protein
MSRLSFAPVLLGALLLGQAPLAAQQPADSLFARRSPALVKYGKWVALAAAVGMGLKAASAHGDAEDAFDRLERYCDVDQLRCTQRPNGSYFDPVAEGYFQTSLSRDSHARGWLLGGEAALLGAAGLFVWELTRPKNPPRNIPFEPTVRVIGARTQLGVLVAF